MRISLGVIAIGLRNGLAQQGRIAVCVSGHVRSLVERRVHESLRGNVIEALGLSDVFMYLELDEARRPDSRINAGWDPGPNSKTSFTRADLVIPLTVLKPVSVSYHDAANSSKAYMGPTPCTYPSDTAREQLEKIHACYSLVVDHEASRGWPYDWIVRTRPDLGWLRPLPPADSFAREHVYVPSNYWPMGDQFALVPRRLAGIYFHAFRSLYTCLAPDSPAQRRWLRSSAGGPEQVLWHHLHTYGASVRPYPFAFVIARAAEAGTQSATSTAGAAGATSAVGAGAVGVCASLWNHLSELCVVLHDVGRSPWPSHGECSFALFQAADQLCRVEFPSPGATFDPAESERVLELLERHSLAVATDGTVRAAAAAALPLPAAHPMIMTSTGGEQQEGQVATAVVLGPAALAAAEHALRCVSAEYHFILRPHGRPGPARCESPFTGALHAAEMHLAAATVRQVTCEGAACAPAGPDYDELVAALRHALA
jgi:hypothetical protein